MHTSLRPQLEKAPICGSMEKSLLPLKKRATSHEHSSADDSLPLVIPPKKIRVVTGSEGIYGITPVQTTARSSDEALPAYCNGGMLEKAETSAAGAARAKTTTKKKRPAPARDGVHRPLPELSHRLGELGATAARFVCTKTLHRSDVNKDQNRLLISCKRAFVDSHPITALFSEKDDHFVFQYEDGLRVSAFDRDGREFGMKLRYLVSNGAYRLITGWSRFVEENTLAGPVGDGRRVDVEVWAFRSPGLPEQPLLEEDEQQLVDGLEDHPNGALGLLLLPYVDDGERINVHRVEEEMEPKTKRRPSAKPVRPQKKKLAVAADHVRANRGKAVAREMTIDEVVLAAGQELADPLIGLVMLRRSSPVPLLMLGTCT